jgi:hypothetical protein
MTLLRYWVYMYVNFLACSILMCKKPLGMRLQCMPCGSAVQVAQSPALSCFQIVSSTPYTRPLGKGQGKKSKNPKGSITVSLYCEGRQSFGVWSPRFVISYLSSRLMLCVELLPVCVTSSFCVEHCIQ